MRAGSRPQAILLLAAAALCSSYTLTTTLPRCRKPDSSCVATQCVPAAIDTFVLFGSKLGTRRSGRLGAWGVRGQEGRAFTASFVDSGATWTLWTQIRELTGRWDCPSNLWAINLAVDVPQQAATVQQPAFYDLAGRRLSARPTRAGVYFERIGPKSYRVLVLR